MEKKKGQDFALGFYMGSYILHKYLPSLSCSDMGRTMKVVDVSQEDTEEIERLSQEWLSCRTEDKNDWIPAWNEYLKYRYVLKQKYLPLELECYLPQVELNDLENIKSGIISCLWDSDVCEYSLKEEDIEIYNEDDDFIHTTIVKLKLDLEIPLK